MSPEKMANFFGSLLILSLGATIVKDMYHDTTHHCLQKNQRVEHYCVSPAKILFGFQDIDGNGTNEFLLNYDGRRYLFKTNELGEPVLQKYDLFLR